MKRTRPVYRALAHPIERPNPRIKNVDISGMLRFRAGRYQLGVEYFRANTTYGGATGKQKASQVSLSVLYSI